MAVVAAVLGLFAGGVANAVAPTVAVAFAPATLGSGDPSTLTITLGNTSASSVDSVGFSATYPTNLVNASPSNIVNTCGGSYTGGISAAGTFGLSGASIAATSSCSISVSVTSNTKGSYATSTGTVTSTGGDNAVGGSATLTVLAKPSVVQSFTAATIAAGGSSTLTLTLTNSNTVGLSAVAFTDLLPTGLVLAATPSNGCGGSVSGISGGGSLALSAGTLSSGGNCTISVLVTAAAAGSYINTAGGVSATQYGGTGAASNSATLTALAPPTIAKSFSPNPVATLTASTLTITLTNPNTTPLTGVAFLDTYPTNFGNTATPNLSTTCPAGTPSGNTLSGNVGLTGGTIAANSSCTVTILVAGVGTGTFLNTTGTVSSSNGGTGSTASASLIIVTSASITKSFNPVTVAVGASSTLTFTLKNASVAYASGFAFTDNLPAGLVVAAMPAFSSNCGGMVSGATANSTSIALSGGALNAGATCTITVAVQSAAVGSYANTTGALSSTLGTSGSSNTATLQVVKPASIVKSFSPASVPLGSPSTLSLVITNPNYLALSGLALSDSFPTNLVMSSTPTVNNSCGGTLSGASAGSGSFSLSGGSLASGPGSTCTISVQVLGPTVGNYSNTSSGAAANETATGAVSNTAILSVTAPDLRVSKSHSGSFVVGSNGVYTVVVDNISGTLATSAPITVTDTLPSGLGYVTAGSGGTGWSCASSVQVITCTSSAVIAAGGSATPITLNVSVGATAVPSVINTVVVAGGGEPAVNANNNLAADYTLVNVAPQSTLSTDGQQTSTAGSVVFYSHIFTAGYAGSVIFASADNSTPAVAGWASSIFQDANCNGILDGTEGNATLSGGVSVSAGGLVCVIDKVFIPATAVYGAQDQTSLTASFTPSSTGSSAIASRIDLTLVGSAGGAGLTLNKTVRNVTTGETARAIDTAASGQVLEYTIAYGNNGANLLSTIAISDSTPYFTRFLSAQCVTPLPSNLSGCSVTTQPTVGAQGSLAWTLSGSLLGSATGSVSFRVTVQ